MSRTSALVACCIASAAAFAASGAEDPLREKARRVHRDAIVLDTHADMTPFFQMDTRPPEITDPGLAGPAYDPAQDPSKVPERESWQKAFPSSWRFTDRHTEGYMDLPRIREGGLDAEFFAIYMEREPRQGMAVKKSLQLIEAVHALAHKYPRDVALATTADDVR